MPSVTPELAKVTVPVGVPATPEVMVAVNVTLCVMSVEVVDD